MRAIPTIYRQVKFRSRLEARWAAMFDMLGWHWEYEPLDLPGWIPDFMVNRTGLEFYHPELDYVSKPILVECKPIIDGKAPRDVQIKIEKALGVPFENDVVVDGFNWTEFFDNLPFAPLTVGATVPCTQREDRHDKMVDYGLGWPFQQTFGWHMPMEPPLMPACELASRWREAGNLVQWKGRSP
jgi:hypothetical protein